MYTLLIGGKKTTCLCVSETGGHSRWSSFPPTRRTSQLSWQSRGWRCQSNLLRTWPIRRTSSMGLFKEEVLWPSSWYVCSCLCEIVCVCVICFTGLQCVHMWCHNASLPVNGSSWNSDSHPGPHRICQLNFTKASDFDRTETPFIHRILHMPQHLHIWIFNNVNIKFYIINIDNIYMLPFKTVGSV